MAKPGWGQGDPDDGAADHEDFIETEEQLALADGDDRLPWLESDDDLDEPGDDTGRIVAFAAVGLLAVVLILGLLYWLIGDRGGDELVADGGVIEAPDEPYKTRPDDPGGREVAGTGRTSFEVAEGQSVEGRIAGSGVPTPSIDRDQTASETDERAEGVGVQVGAYSSREAAESGWSTLSARIEALQGRNHRIVQGTADSGTIYRLQAISETVSEAETLCRSVKSQGGDCQVKR